MRRVAELTIGLAVGIALGPGVANAVAQADKYPTMVAIDQYLMGKDAEIALARSAAPDSISHGATILVLGRRGYDNAVSGNNGFVCFVARSWLAAFDWPEFWNPKIRAPDCMNPQAARFVVPIVLLRSRMTMAGRSRAEVMSALKTALANRTLPNLDSGAMDYMMSKGAYLTDQGQHNGSHLMFLATGLAPEDWGAGAVGSPVMAAPYWFFSSRDPSDLAGLPRILVFLVGVADWSDGTSASRHGSR